MPPPEPREGTDGSKRYEGVTYAAPAGYRPLQLDVWVPASAAPPPLVVWIHGGAWLFGDRRYLPETLRPNQLFEELINAGLAVATIDYRHALEAQFPAQLHDVKAAVRYLRAYADALGVDTSRRCPRAPRNRHRCSSLRPTTSWSAGKIKTRTLPPARLATSPRRLRRSCSCTAQRT
jgi:hypothetical protein